MNDSTLTGRVAWVTGSTRGLGKEIALELGRRGAAVAMNFANNSDAAARAFADLQAVQPKSCLVQGDVTDAAEIARMHSEIASQIGPVDILVPNATCEQPQLSFEEYDWEFFQSMLDFFVKSPALLTKAVLPHMKQQRWGRIVHITSEVFALGMARFSAYVAAKGGQIGFARSTAREFAPFGITVNCVAPGWIPVERHADDPQEAKDGYLAGVPAGYFGTPADVAAAVCFFASDKASFITGQSIAVNGGNTLP